MAAAGNHCGSGAPPGWDALQRKPEASSTKHRAGRNWAVYTAVNTTHVMTSDLCALLCLHLQRQHHHMVKHIQHQRLRRNRLRSKVTYPMRMFTCVFICACRFPIMLHSLSLCQTWCSVQRPLSWMCWFMCGWRHLVEEECLRLLTYTTVLSVSETFQII